MENDWQNMVELFLKLMWISWTFQEYLTEDALAAVKALLPDQAEGDLSNVCFWADEVRHHYHYRWSAPLHYVDTPDFLCNYKYCRKWHYI